MVRRVRESVAAIAVAVVSVMVALAISMLLIAIAGESPMAAVRAMFSASFGGVSQIGGMLRKLVPLTLVSLGWVVAFSVRRINVGLEGQILAGGTLATLVGLHVAGMPAVIQIAAVSFVGAIGGLAWAGVAAWLWARRNVNEIISTLLLNFVMIQIVSWLVNGPLEEPTHTLGQTGPISPSARWPMIEALRTRWDIVLVPIGVAVIYVLLTRTRLGFRMRATGSNNRFAAYSGLRTVRVSVLAMIISGGLAGLAGASLISSNPAGNMGENFSANFGFEGIAVALLARNHPIGCLPAAVLFAVLRQGGSLMEAQAGISSGLVLVTQGLVIGIVAASNFYVSRYRRRRIDATGQATRRTAAVPAREAIES